MKTVKVFISHATNDVVLAKAFVECLEGCLEIPDGAIRCTSVPGYKLTPGVVSDEVLLENLAQCSMVIGLLTDASLQSGYVLLELGAAWGLRKPTSAVLLPQVGFDRIPGPLASRHAIKAATDYDVVSLMDVVADVAGLQKRNSAKCTTAVNAFVTAATAYPF